MKVRPVERFKDQVIVIRWTGQDHPSPCALCRLERGNVTDGGEEQKKVAVWELKNNERKHWMGAFAVWTEGKSRTSEM